MIGQENTLERMKIIYASYDDPKGKKKLYVSCTMVLKGKFLYAV